MGYHTDFNGSLTLTGNITKEQFDYINQLAETRRMKRDVKKLYKTYDGKFGKPNTSEMIEIDGVHVLNVYGNEGEYFVGGTGSFGQDHDASVIDYNTPPGQFKFSSEYSKNKNLIKRGLYQPGLWCSWVLVSDDDLTDVKLEWNGSEKFYSYVEWLKYLISHFFEPWGIKLNGEITWEGEDSGDLGKIVVDNNEVSRLDGVVTYG